MDSRRQFMKTAIVIGGMNALSACLSLSEETDDITTPSFPQGSERKSSLPERQHAWGDYIVRNARQNPVFPQHQTALYLNYTGNIPPSADERNKVESALQSLEQAYQWGTGGNDGVVVNNGLLFTLAYSPQYFNQFEKDLHETVDLPSAEQVLRELDDDPDKADPYDAVFHFGSDHPEIVLAVEEALFGNVEQLNGVSMEDDFTGVFERAERRAGVIGRGMVNKEVENDEVPERSPLSMGFKSNFKDAIPSEDKITITKGPFAEGTTQHFSRIVIELDRWYDVTHGDRVKRMFGPDYTEEDVGKVGDALGGRSQITEDQASSVEEDAVSRGTVGHTQKTARARDDDFDPVILRRGEFIGPHKRGSVLSFGSLQEQITDFIRTRKAMENINFEQDDEENESNPHTDLDSAHDGILDYIDVTNRAVFLVPPRSLRALPTPQPE